MSSTVADRRRWQRYLALGDKIYCNQRYGYAGSLQAGVA
jgi:hypothetical protein